MKDKFMLAALKEARKAFEIGEVPVGCVIVKDDKIIARAHNKRESLQQATAHAEVLAINKACKKVGFWRLNDCEMYVTLEPCSMCSGAIIQSRIEKIYIGALDAKTGAAGSVYNLFDFPFNHKVIVEKGIMADDCQKILKDFFINLRIKDR